jgi:hypothetical protein
MALREGPNSHTPQACSAVVGPDPNDGSSTRLDFTSCATVSLAEAGYVLGIHRSTAWDLFKRGDFPVPVLQVGHRLRVTKVHLERFLLGSSQDDLATGQP